MKRIAMALGAVALLSAGLAVAALGSGNGGYWNTISTITGTTGTTGTITVPTTPTTTVPKPPPPEHDCTFTGAGKDGQPGNDDCATVPPRVTVTASAASVVCPPGQTVTQTVTVTKTVQSPPKVVTKVVNHVKTRVIYRTRTIVKVKKIYVPGMHKHGVEGSG